jgi:hypothetical protein
LCHSLLSESKYNEVVKITEENLKKENELKRQLHSVKEAKDKLEIEKKNIEKNYKIRLEKDKEQIKRDFEKQKSSLIKKAQEDAKKLAKKDIDKANKEKLESERGLKKKIVLAQKEFLEKGKEFEKRRSEKLTNSLKHITDERNKLFDRTRELEKQLKEAKTPQQEGFDFEKELANELQKTFKNDKIVPKGHGGDIFHHIIHDNKEIALIIYECKKTQKHSQSHIKQIRNDVINNKAKYGILVTFASDKNKSGFWIEKDILVVHPHGARYIAEVLRNSLMELYSHKLNDKEIGERAKKLLDYIKSNKFRNSVKDNILRSIELQKMLDLEKDYHETLWKKRGEHYQSIAQKSSEIEKESKSIVGEDSNEQIIEIEINPPRKKKKIEDLNY